MKLAVIGSREFSDYDYMKTILKWYDCTQIISGGAKGADKLAKKYAAENNIQIKEFLPNWNAHGKSAGYIRNKDIIKNCDEVVAFWNKKSKGTKSSINIAIETGKPVSIYWSELKQGDLSDDIGL